MINIEKEKICCNMSKMYKLARSKFDINLPKDGLIGYGLNEKYCIN